MNEKQIQLVQKSFKLVKPIAHEAAGMFYGRLFELDPSLRAYFKDDLSEQQDKLATALEFAISGLNEPETILPEVEALGYRHGTYGVRPEHYHLAGGALMWTLGQGLGDQFTEDLEEAWLAAYNLLVNTMMAGADQEAII